MFVFSGEQKLTRTYELAATESVICDKTPGQGQKRETSADLLTARLTPILFVDKIVGINIENL